MGGCWRSKIADPPPPRHLDLDFGLPMKYKWYKKIFFRFFRARPLNLK